MKYGGNWWDDDDVYKTAIERIKLKKNGLKAGQGKNNPSGSGSGRATDKGR